MTQEELADKILLQYEDDREYHFSKWDREWIIEAMIEFANKVNVKVNVDPDKVIKTEPKFRREL